MLNDKINYWADEVDYKFNASAKRYFDKTNIFTGLGTDCSPGGDHDCTPSDDTGSDCTPPDDCGTTCCPGGDGGPD